MLKFGMCLMPIFKYGVMHQPSVLHSGLLPTWLAMLLIPFSTLNATSISSSMRPLLFLLHSNGQRLSLQFPNTLPSILILSLPFPLSTLFEPYPYTILSSSLLLKFAFIQVLIFVSFTLKERKMLLLTCFLAMPSPLLANLSLGFLSATSCLHFFWFCSLGRQPSQDTWLLEQFREHHAWVLGGSLEWSTTKAYASAFLSYTSFCEHQHFPI